MAIYVNDHNKITDMFVNVNGSKKKIVSAWGNNNGVVTKIFPLISHKHDYTSTIIKQPTCTENGVKTFTCSGCGYSYTEEIPTTGHNYIDNVFAIQWQNINNGKYKFVQNDNKWMSNNQGMLSTIATSTWQITVPISITYSLSYLVFTSKYDVFSLKVDSTMLLKNIYGYKNNNLSINLNAGTHTLTAEYAKSNLNESANGYVYIILDDIIVSNENHICSICNNTEDHIYDSDGNCIVCGSKLL